MTNKTFAVVEDNNNNNEITAAYRSNGSAWIERIQRAITISVVFFDQFEIVLLNEREETIHESFRIQIADNYVKMNRSKFTENWKRRGVNAYVPQT